MKTFVAVAAVLLFSSSVFAQNCGLVIPQNALTASGLATLFNLTTVPGTTGQTCCQACAAAFVQGAIINIDTGAVNVYNPLVVDIGTTAAIAPTKPTLPTNYVAALWFGYNGGTLTLLNPGTSTTALTVNNCVNGFGGTIFGQFSYCNAPNFFAAAENAILNGTLTIPTLGTALDGKPCPTNREFTWVDQDPSDNVLTTYLSVTTNGVTTFAQDTPTNTKALAAAGATVVTNGSDNRLIQIFVDTALGCTPWTVQDLAEVNQVSLLNALPLNEIMAEWNTATPQALIPANDPMVLLNGGASVEKINAFRAGVYQPAVQNTQVDANPTTFCQNFAAAIFPRVQANMARLQAAPSLDPANTANLYLFLKDERGAASFQAGGLNCVGLGVANPFTTTTTTTTTTAATTTLNSTLVLVLAVTGGALVLIGVGAGVFIFVQRRKAASTAANNFLAL